MKVNEGALTESAIRSRVSKVLNIAYQIIHGSLQRSEFQAVSARKGKSSVHAKSVSGSNTSA